MAKRDGRNQAPTAKRRRDARRDGRLPRSPEVPPAVALLTVVAAGTTFVPKVLRTMMTELHRSLADLGDGKSLFTGRLLESARRMGLSALPMVLIGTATGIVTIIVQGGVVIGSKQAKPSLKHLSLKRGFGRLNPKQAAPNLLKAVLKLAVLAYSAWGPVRSLWSATQDGHGLTDTLGRFGQALKAFLWQAAALLAIIAALDYLNIRRKLKAELKMTKQEITDEHKLAEGDPRVKANRRRKAYELARRRALPPISLADVIVTNPTHYAVALCYSEGSAAPRVIGKGVNSSAARIRREAVRNGVPIVENRPLARALYRQCKLGAFIPTQLFDEVVGVLITAYWRRGRFPAFLQPKRTAA